MLQRLIIAVAVCFSAATVVSSGWSQSRPPRKAPSYVESIDNGWSYFDTPAYNETIKKSVDAYKSAAERMAIGQILDDLHKKSYLEILALKLAPDVCQEIACRAVSSESVRRYVEAYGNMRIADDAHETALRNAAAAERSTLIATVSASVSLLSLLISVLSYRRTVRSTKSAIPA